MRLIDADMADVIIIYDKENELTQVSAIRKYIERQREFLDKFPTIYAIPVVRCRECKHWKPTGSKAGNSFSDMEYIGGCEFTKYCRRESDFCSYGERKRGANNEP